MYYIFVIILYTKYYISVIILYTISLSPSFVLYIIFQLPSYILYLCYHPIYYIFVTILYIIYYISVTILYIMSLLPSYILCIKYYVSVTILYIISVLPSYILYIIYLSPSSYISQLLNVARFVTNGFYISATQLLKCFRLIGKSEITENTFISKVTWRRNDESPRCEKMLDEVKNINTFCVLNYLAENTPVCDVQAIMCAFYS